MRYLLSLFLAGHGFAHIVGFVVFWRLATLEQMPYKTTILGGRVDVGDRGIRVVGVFWLLATIGFALAAAALALKGSWAVPFTVAVSTFSAILCVVGWPDSRIGVFVNLGLLVLLLVGPRVGLSFQ